MTERSAQNAQTEAGGFQAIICRLASQDYGIRITAVREIIRLEPATSLPDTPHFVDGIINFRGESVPVIDLRKYLGLTANAHTPDSRTIVLDLEGQTTGLIVDGVTEVVTIPADAIDTHEDRIVSQSNHVAGVARLHERLIILLQVEEVAASTHLAAAA